MHGMSFGINSLKTVMYQVQHDKSLQVLSIQHKSQGRTGIGDVGRRIHRFAAQMPQPVTFNSSSKSMVHSTYRIPTMFSQRHLMKIPRDPSLSVNTKRPRPRRAITHGVHHTTFYKQGTPKFRKQKSDSHLLGSSIPACKRKDLNFEMRGLDKGGYKILKMIRDCILPA